MAEDKLPTRAQDFSEWYNQLVLKAFLIIVPALALAGSLAAKKIAASSAGTFPVSGGTFIAILIGTILIVGALTFFPVWALGPIVEHFQMHGSTKLY